MNYKKFGPGLLLCLLIGLFIAGYEKPSSYSGPPDAPSTQKTGGKSRANKPVKSPAKVTLNKTVVLDQLHGDQAVPQRAQTIVVNNREYPVRVYAPLLTPNDPQATQWWTSNSRLNETWDLPAGSSPTLLAIIDTGFALGHEEFANRWYSNSGETGSAVSEGPSKLNCTARGMPVKASCNLIDEDGDGIVDNENGTASYENASRLNCSDQQKPIARDCNQLDDDSNGFVDDYRGWDFVNFDNSAQAGELNPTGEGVSHGTAVAGVAAATGNNAKGIAGVDWNTKILPLQALDDDAYGDTLSVARAILYAAAQGADVISLSLGSELSDEYVRQAVEAAIAAGSVVVAASGNDGCDCIVYPANYPEVVAVGALRSDNQPANFSSWGTNLDVLAPGTQINSATWTPTNPTSAYVSNVNGTSFATPLVSGVLSRLASHQPTATPLQLIAALTENADHFGLSAHSTKLGYGKLDSFKASQRMTTPQSFPQVYAFGPVSQGDNYRFTRSEPASVQVVQACDAGAVGTTSLYELFKSDSSFFSISRVEVKKAQIAGYSTNTMGAFCLQQPHDTPAAIRSINLFKEIRDLGKVNL